MKKLINNTIYGRFDDIFLGAYLPLLLILYIYLYLLLKKRLIVRKNLQAFVFTSLDDLTIWLDDLKF